MDETERREERRNRELQRRKEQQDTDLRVAMSSVEGRRLIWRILDEIAGVTEPSYTAGDTHETARREGRRSVGLDLLTEVQRIEPSRFVQMMNEEMQRRQEAALRVQDDEEETT